VSALSAVLAFVVGCGGSSTPSVSSPGTPHASATSTSKLVLVVLGDSDATGAGDSTGLGWAGAYAVLVDKASTRGVDLRNRAQEGMTSAALAAALRDDTDPLAVDVKAADLIAIGIGGGDLNDGDAAVLAGGCQPKKCYDDVLAAYGRNIEAITAQIVRLRAGAPVVLRAITLPHVVPGAEDVIPKEVLASAKQFGLLQATSLRDSTCKAMRAHGGNCIDVLTAFNGPSGTANGYATGLLNHDDCCYPSTKGQQLMAKLVYDLGVEPTALH
jgi:lysophospholipase L1-like esterase